MVETPGGGLSTIPIISDAIDLLTEIFSQAAQIADLTRATEQVEAQAWANTLNLAGFAYGLFGGILDSLGALLQGLGSLLKHLLVDIIYGHLKALLDAIWKQLTDKHSWLRRMVTTLQGLQKQYNAAMNKTLRKYIDLVQRIRKVLLPFRLLHIGFAQKLDAKLLGFEGRLGQMWAAIIAHQNLVGQILNDVVDPRGLLRPGSILGSFGIMIGAIHDAIGAFAPGSLLCLLEGGTVGPESMTWVAYRPQVTAYITGQDPQRGQDASTAAQVKLMLGSELGTG